MSEPLDRALAGMSSDARGLTGPKVTVALAVSRLMNCAEHGGTHHFIVTSEGKGLVVNPTGYRCLLGWQNERVLTEVKYE